MIVAERQFHLPEGKEKELLLLLIQMNKPEHTPTEVSRELNVTDKPVIDRLSVLSKNRFVVPVMTKQRIRSCELSDFTKDRRNEISRKISPGNPKQQKQI